MRASRSYELGDRATKEIVQLRRSYDQGNRTTKVIVRYELRITLERVLKVSLD